jgi:hypothetical protein
LLTEDLDAAEKLDRVAVGHAALNLRPARPEK